jgi:cyclopropane fatty-acyl-phospholipid synthase-like methyltransferase
MDIWLYYDVTHADHTYCNPINSEKVDKLGRVLELTPGTRVLDIACGHAEMLVRWCERYGIQGVGVDLSPYATKRAERRRRERVPGGDVRIVMQDGKEFEAAEPFDVALCVGASWIWDGYVGTLAALKEYVKPGGLIVSGEPYWIQDPPDEYLEAEGITREQFFTLEGCRTRALEQGLEVVWMVGSSLDDWDRYEMDQPRALDRFAHENPEHPDLGEIRARRARADEIYLRWGRSHMGFAIWVFRAPGS